MRGNDPKKFTDKNHLGVPEMLNRKVFYRRSPYSRWNIWASGILGITMGTVLTGTAIFGESGLLESISFLMTVVFLYFVSLTIFFARGIFLGLKEISKHKRVLSKIKNDPNTPWLWDFENNSKGVMGARLRYSIWEEIMQVFIFLLFGILVGFIIHVDTLLGAIVSLVFFCAWFFVWGKSALKNILNIIHYFKFGKGRFVFTKFPFFLGSTLRAKVSNLPPKEKINDLVLKLRFIQEEIIDSGKVNFLEYFFDQKILSIQDLDVDGNLPIEWPLPDNPEFTTNLSERPAKYWELEVKAKTTGIDYHERFLLPVYAKA